MYRIAIERSILHGLFFHSVGRRYRAFSSAVHPALRFSIAPASFMICPVNELRGLGGCLSPLYQAFSCHALQLCRSSKSPSKHFPRNPSTSDSRRSSECFLIALPTCPANPLTPVLPGPLGFEKTTVRLSENVSRVTNRMHGSETTCWHSGGREERNGQTIIQPID